MALLLLLLFAHLKGQMEQHIQMDGLTMNGQMDKWKDI